MPGIVLTEHVEPAEGQHPSDFECQCAIDDRAYTLQIEEGRPSITCKLCQKSFPYEEWWGEESLWFGPVDIELNVTVENGGSEDVYVWMDAELCS